MKIVTGVSDSAHVTSKEFRKIMEGAFGQESYILSSGDNLAPEMASNNLLKVLSGAMVHHGNVSSVESYDEIGITNGTQGVQRIDLVVNRYRRDAETGIESNEWIVIQGKPVNSNPVPPAYTVGNMQEGDLVDDCPVFEIHFDGINVTEVKTILEVVPSADVLKRRNEALDGEIKDLNNEIENLNADITGLNDEITSLKKKNTTLSNEINALKNKTPYSKISIGKASLEYYDSSWLQGTVYLDKSYSSGAQKIISIDYVNGAALLSENYPTLSAVVNGNLLTIYASGSFVPGHRLEVGYFVIE